MEDTACSKLLAGCAARRLLWVGKGKEDNANLILGEARLEHRTVT